MYIAIYRAILKALAGGFLWRVRPGSVFGSQLSSKPFASRSRVITEGRNQLHSIIRVAEEEREADEEEDEEGRDEE